MSQDIVIPWMESPRKPLYIITEGVERIYKAFEKEELHGTFNKILEITLGTDTAYFSDHAKVFTDTLDIFLKYT
jgi:hypothetical protein